MLHLTWEDVDWDEGRIIDPSSFADLEELCGEFSDDFEELHPLADAAPL